MDWYPWLNAPYRQILAGYQQGKGHHALLIHAPAGNGDASLFYALSRWLICRQPEGIKSCGHCHSCRLMLAGTHPDFYRPEPEKGRLSLGVDDIRHIIDALCSHAQQGGAKVVWLPDCERLTEQGANALLKTLEEPPARTYFLLGCREPSHLLPTLRSRCLYWHIPAPQESVALRWMRQQGAEPPERAQTALRLSGGAPVGALELLQPARWAQREALCNALLEALSGGDFLALAPLLNQEKDKEPLYWLQSLLTDALKRQQGAAEYILNQDKLPLVGQLAARFNAGVLHHQLHQWQECARQWRDIAGLNRELLLTNQLLNWEQETPDGRLHPWTL